VAKRAVILLLLAGLLGACSQPPAVDTIRQGGVLRVAFQHTAVPLLDGYAGPAGFEHDLADRFAARLGVKLEPLLVPDKYELRGLLASGEAHLAAYALPINERLGEHLLFARPFHRAQAEVVYRYGRARPKSLDGLDGRLVVALDEGHAVQLELLKAQHPQLSWEVNESVRTMDLLAQVASGKLDYTLAYSHELQVARHIYPDLRSAFPVGDFHDFAWALSPDADDSLLFSVQDFFDDLETSGKLQALLERYFGHFEKFDFVEMREFQRRIDSRLPLYDTLFQGAAGDDVDWRLLAAISYQESHWDPQAKSPTGVRGMMMLTRDAAKQMHVEDRKDPLQSIRGGADYLRWVRSKIPQRIGEPDRTWLALATYNIGFGHLEDARRLTQRNGGNPDLWKDVKRFLPLLTKKKWYAQTKHGFARGGEAVAYVNNVRTFYDILNRRLQLDEEQLTLRLIPVPKLIPLAF